MNRGRLLGVDFGTVRVGLAVCDADRRIASPLEIRERQGDDRDAAYFRQVVAREQIVGLVVGLPMHTDGREGVKAREARAYADWLVGVTALPVAFGDERFSTAFAESALWEAGLSHKKRKARRDAVAAQMMLQEFIDRPAEAEAVSQALGGPA